MIAILLPVLARPDRPLDLARNIREVTETEHRIVFVCSPGDTAEIAACAEAGAETGAHVLVADWSPGRADWARKINLGLRMTVELWMLLGADDLRFHPGWDVEALRVADATGAGVVGTNDLGNPTVMRGRHSTHPLVSRRYAEERGTVDRPGVLVSEVYAHNWVDTELVETAKARGEWAFAERSHVEHLHPFWKKGTGDDEVYRAGRKHYAADAKLYRRRERLWARERVTA